MTTLLNGVDVSRYQAKTPPLVGLDFLFARATYGTWHDPLFPMHAANARLHDVAVGAYHFGTSGPVGPQVAAFLAAAGKVDFYVLDLESESGKTPMSAAQARSFIAAVRATGKRCGLYHSDSGFPSLGQDWNWVAKWSATAPSRNWAFWQYRGSPLDLDHFKGSLEQLRALAHPPVHEPVETAPAEWHARFPGGAFWVYRIVDGIITPSSAWPNGRRSKRFSGPTGAPCTAPRKYPWPGHTDRRLVRITAGLLDGNYVSAPIGSTAVVVENVS
jgi:hypothetical protein